MLTAICWETIDKRIKRREPTAAEELAEKALGPLRTRLKRRFWWVRDQDFIIDAVVDCAALVYRAP